jgi:hypothetical protein
MSGRPFFPQRAWGTLSCVALMGLLASCGGGKGAASPSSSGSDKTFLNAQVIDPEGDTLTYEWRVTAGSVENRNSPKTVWSMPAGTGLHFAYLLVSDGKGGQVEYQYAVSTDRIDNPAPTPVAVVNSAPTVASGDEINGATARLRLHGGDLTFTSGSSTGSRRVFLPDVRVAVTDTTTSTVVFNGTTNLGGEVALPALVNGRTYNLNCTDAQGQAYSGCGSINGDAESGDFTLPLTAPAGRNLRVHGHVGLADGGVCGGSNEFFGISRSATVQLLNANGGAASAPVRVNQFGDYRLDAAVPQQADLKLRVSCGNYATDLTVNRPAGGFVSGSTVELSHTVPNRRPQVVRMVANGPEGNLRGLEVLPETNAHSIGLVGSTYFLTYKGLDTKLSACMYYRSFGAVADCDAQGNMVRPITLDDWKRQNGFSPYNNGNTEVSATYINRRDLNLVRKMVATRTAPDRIAFVVCNHPGPETDRQNEVDAVMDTALLGDKMVACVAMEHTPTPGRSGGAPFTKFLTFNPSGQLIASVNLDGRGEKFMPGACVACHGGARYISRFPTLGNPSPDLGSSFLAFDSGNYAYASRPGLTEEAQQVAIKALNDLVKATNPATATRNLIDGWYAADPTRLNKDYVPSVWASYQDPGQGITTADSQRFYREVVATSCRTCHAAMRDGFDWDSGPGTPQLLFYSGSNRICGGGSDLHTNGSMPNALASVDRLQAAFAADPTLATLTQKLLGCTTSAGDPVFPKR